MKTIAISGSSGFVGTCLKNYFANDYEILPIKRSDLSDEIKLKSIMEKSHIVINLSGANILARWSEKYKKILHESRINTTNSLVKAINNSKNKPELFISTSAIGIYSNHLCHDEIDFKHANDFLANLCKDWESSANKCESRVAIFRLGVVLGNGGALKQMLLPFKLGLGGKIGSGKQAFSFIHIKDLLKAYKFIIENENLSGVFNLVSPNPTTNEKLTYTLAKTLKRPAFFTVPKFVLKLIYSSGASVLTEGQSVKPKRLLENGFKFEFENIEQAIKDLSSD